MIVRQGDPCDCLLILKEGAVKEVVKAPLTNPYKNELTHRMNAGDIEIGLRTKGSFLGEVDIANSKKQQHTTCIASSNCKLYMVDLDAYSKFLKRSIVDHSRLVSISKSRSILTQQRVDAVSEFRAKNPALGGSRQTRKGLKPLRRGRASPTKKMRSKFLTFEELSGQ